MRTVLIACLVALASVAVAVPVGADPSSKDCTGHADSFCWHNHGPANSFFCSVYVAGLGHINNDECLHRPLVCVGCEEKLGHALADPIEA